MDHVAPVPADPQRRAAAVPLSLWPEATRRQYERRRDGLHRALERLENLREWMVAKLDVLEGDADLEPSLGSGELDLSLYTRRGLQSLDQRQWARGVSDDREADGDVHSASDSDFEPSLGSSGGTAAGGPRQIHWARRGHAFIVDGEEGHDGREPEEDQNTGDDEPNTLDLPVPIYVSDHDQTRYAKDVYDPWGIAESDASTGAR